MTNSSAIQLLKIALVASPCLVLAAAGSAQASVAYGSINNFDVVNDTGVPCHGFEIEIRLYAHSQGYDMVERPMLRADEPMLLEENMHFAVHPGYNTATMWSTICDNYLVEANGVGDCLHKTEKKIFEIN